MIGYHIYDELYELFDEMPQNLTPWVFINPRTGDHYPKNINRDVWNPACQKALGYIFPLNNAGRHSFANELIEKGIDLKTVGFLLRHRDDRVTEDHYANPSLDAARKVVDNVTGLIRK